MEQRHTLAEAAKVLGTTAKTLRNWEKRPGFPIPRKDVNGWRYYYPADLERIRDWRDGLAE